MTVLGAWLKQLVLLVLLAAVTDLLLPAQALQKYVRVVMGLAIIAVILQPLVPFFQRDWSTRVAQTAVQELFSQPSETAQPPPALPGLSASIAHQEEQVADKFTAQAIGQAVTTQFGIPVQRVDVQGARLGANALQVTLWIAPQYQHQQDALRQWTAKTLGIRLNRVDVRVTEGGDTGGF